MPTASAHLNLCLCADSPSDCRQLDRGLALYQRNPAHNTLRLEINTASALNGGLVIVPKHRHSYLIDFAEKRQQNTITRTVREIKWEALEPEPEPEPELPQVQLPERQREAQPQPQLTIAVAPPVPKAGAPGPRQVKAQAMAAQPEPEPELAAQLLPPAKSVSFDERTTPPKPQSLPSVQSVGGAGLDDSFSSALSTTPSAVSGGSSSRRRRRYSATEQSGAWWGDPTGRTKMRTLVSWQQVWEDAAKQCPTLPKYDPSWVQEGHGAVPRSITIGTKTITWRDVTKGVLPTIAEGEKRVALNGVGGEGFALPMAEVLGEQPLAALTQLLNAVGRQQTERRAGRLDLDACLLGWGNAAEVMEALAAAELSLASVEIDVSGSSSDPSRIDRTPSSAPLIGAPTINWADIWSSAATNWRMNEASTKNQKSQSMCHVSILARQCNWLQLGALEAICGFGRNLAQLDLSNNLGVPDEEELDPPPSLRAAARTTGAFISAELLQDFADACGRDARAAGPVLGLNLKLKNCGLRSPHLKALASVPLSQLDISHSLRQARGSAGAPPEEAFTPAAMEIFFKKQQQVWTDTHMYEPGPSKHRDESTSDRQFCWALTAFRAQSCGLSDSHVVDSAGVWKYPLKSLQKMNLSNNLSITVAAQDKIRESQEEQVGADEFELLCTKLCWLDVLVQLRFSPSGLPAPGKSKGENLRRLRAWAEGWQLDVLSEELKEICIDDASGVASSGALSRQSTTRRDGSPLSRQSTSSGRESPIMEKEFSVHLNGEQIHGDEAGSAAASESMRLMENDDERLSDEAYAARKELGVFLRGHIYPPKDNTRKWRALLSLIKDKQDKGQVCDLSLELQNSRWSQEHVDELRRSGVHISKLKIGWAEFRNDGMLCVAETGYTRAQIRSLTIERCQDKHLEAFSEFIVINLLINDNT